MIVDYYKMLEIEKHATIAQIKSSYRRLALLYHPDRNKNSDASQKFIDITEAYEVLSNEQKRMLYNILYEQYSGSNPLGSNTDETFQKHQNSWKQEATKKAEDYAAMSFEQFSTRVFTEIKVSAKYIPTLSYIVFCILGFISTIRVLPKAFSDDSAPRGAGLMIIIVAISFILVAIFLFVRMKDKYFKERTNTFKK